MENRDEQINIRVTKKEKERIKYLSKKFGYEHFGEYVRNSSLNLRNIKGKVGKMKVVYTLTLNPALDMVLNVKNSEEVIKYDDSEVEYFAGGKGINVSKVVNEFGVPTVALHYSGGFTGKYIRDNLEEENINQIMFESLKPTRINIKLNLNDDNTKEISGIAETIPLKETTKILKTINQFDKGDTLVITGSFNKENENLLFKISNICNLKGVNIVYDLSSNVLLELLKYKPLLVKPNLEELQTIFKTKIKSKNQIKDLMYEMQELGAQNIAITLGKDGSYFLSKDKTLYKVTIKKKINQVSSQGAGDSFVGAFLSNSNKSVEEQIIMANAAGAATASKKGLATISEIKELVNNIKIEKWGNLEDDNK